MFTGDHYFLLGNYACLQRNDFHHREYTQQVGYYIFYETDSRMSFNTKYESMLDY